MRAAGIDIGSRSIELVIVEDGEIVLTREVATGYDPMGNVSELLSGIQYDQIIATGYGRDLFEVTFDGETVTEIKAYATGARKFYPDTEVILDIGGQDTKVIALSPSGRVKKFEMNDRCAAGTGKFLELMARTLGYTIPEFGEAALGGDQEITINSMCAVFAESEVTSLIAKGANRNNIALGLHNSVLKRALGMINRIAPGQKLLFAGGVANNRCMQHLLQKQLNTTLYLPEQPQFIGACGAAILASKKLNK